MAGPGATLEMPKRNDVSVKVDAEAVEIARNVATVIHKVPLAEYLSRVVMEAATREWDTYIDEAHKRKQGPEGKGAK